MRLDCRQLTARVIRRSAIGSLASFTALSGFVAAGAMADPAEDALAKLNELSRQAEQTTEAMHSAELDLGAKLAAQQAAENKLTDDQAALDAAKGQLASFQTAVNKVAAAAYMGGRANGMDTILTAPSPQLLIDGLSMQRVMAHQMATQMSGFRTAREQAAKAEQASEKSAADAKSAAEQAAAVRANLQHKQSQLQVQIAVVKSQYLALTPDQRIALPHSSQALAHGGQPVSLSDLQPGDVLTFYSDASHAGIYIGDGLMVHSSTYGVPVRVVPMNSSGPIYDARRY